LNWETTVDPAKRPILKVSIEERVGADTVSTKLVGDKQSREEGLLRVMRRIRIWIFRDLL